VLRDGAAVWSVPPPSFIIRNRWPSDERSSPVLQDDMFEVRGSRFETDAAIRAGNAVRDELRKSAAAGKRREL
jgi:hypothetical protein